MSSHRQVNASLAGGRPWGASPSEAIDALSRLAATLAASSPSELAEDWVTRAAARLPVRALHLTLRSAHETRYWSSPGEPPPADGWQQVEEAVASGRTTVSPSGDASAPSGARIVVPWVLEGGPTGALIAEAAPSMVMDVVGALEAVRWPLGLRLAGLVDTPPAAMAASRLAVQDLCEALHRCETLTELVHLLLGVLPGLIGGDWAAVATYDPQGRLLHVTSLDSPPPVSVEGWTRLAALGAESDDRPTSVAAADFTTEGAAEARLAVLPLRTDKSPLRHVLAIRGHETTIEPAALALLEHVVAHARVSLARVVAAGELRLALDAHDRVLRITGLLTSMKHGESPDQVLNSAMEAVLRETPGSVAAVLHLRTGEELVHEQSAGVVPPGMCSGAGLRWWQDRMAESLAAGEAGFRPLPEGCGGGVTLVTLPILASAAEDDGGTAVGVASLFAITADPVDLVLRTTPSPFSHLIAQLVHNLQHYRALERADRELEQRKVQIIESKSALEAILDGFPDGLFIVDRDLRVTLSNDVQALRVQGSGSATGQYCWELFGSGSGVCPGCRVVDTLKKGVSTRRRMRVRRPGEPEREWEVATHPIARRSARSTQAALVVVRDVTEQQQIAQSLAQVEKMAAVGRLATGIAHEINNPLAAIQANVQLLLEGADPADDQYESLAIMRRSADRARRVVRNLLSFSAQSLDDVAPVDVNAGIRSALDLATHQAQRGGVTLECCLADDLPQVIASQEQLESVWLNLALNALDAVLETGVAGRIAVTSDAASRDKVRVTFRDNGPGIAPDRLPHVFEPFGSNTSPTVGTGLGLFSCHSVIARHGGTIRAGVGEGGGSLFEVLLPALAEGNGEPDDAIDVNTLATGSA